jgi:hypothetical protein
MFSVKLKEKNAVKIIELGFLFCFHLKPFSDSVSFETLDIVIVTLKATHNDT